MDLRDDLGLRAYLFHQHDVAWAVRADGLPAPEDEDRQLTPVVLSDAGDLLVIASGTLPNVKVASRGTFGMTLKGGRGGLFAVAPEEHSLDGPLVNDHDLVAHRLFKNTYTAARNFTVTNLHEYSDTASGYLTNCRRESERRYRFRACAGPSDRRDDED